MNRRRPSRPRVVRYIRLRCPWCQSARIRSDGTKGRVRYHSCKNCGRRFKSIEETLDQYFARIHRR